MAKAMTEGLLMCYIKQLLSAIDKLLGQLSIYATWLSSIAYNTPRFWQWLNMFSY